ncbi:MAG: PAS domain-containing protein [Deltaproteobacteria bacterium]|nr:PAS domain-containing protein [Deltaproteobacteria bacterium]
MGRKPTYKELEQTVKELKERVKERTYDIDSILKDTPAMVFIKDQECRYRMVNSRYEELFGVRNKDIQGKTAYDIFPKETADRLMAIDLKVLAEGRSFQVEESISQKNGIHTYLSLKFPLHDEHGNIRSLCGIATDITEHKEAQAQLRLLSAKIMNSQEEERAAIARELHDEVGQILTALRMDAVWIRDNLKNEGSAVQERATAICELIDKGIDEVQGLAIRLRPAVLDDLGLVDALEWYTGEFEKRSGIACTFNLSNVPHVENILATAAYRVAQEALTNVARHSYAGHVDVGLKHEGTMLTLSVVDDGRGFNADLLSESDSLGIAGMRERATLVGGNLELESQTGKGTCVRLRVPVRGPGGVK